MKKMTRSARQGRPNPPKPAATQATAPEDYGPVAPPLSGSLVPETPPPVAPPLSGSPVPENTPPATPQIRHRGELDAIVDNRIHGWAHSAGEEGTEPRQYFLFIDGRPYARFSATGLRPDLAGTVVPDGRCGFQIPLQEAFCDGGEHRFSLRVTPDEATELHGKILTTAKAHASEPRPPLQGFVDRQEGLFVQGWVYDPALPERPVPVELLADGESCGHALANLYREDVAGSGVGDGRHAFALRIPNHLLDGRSCRLTVREGITGALLPGVSLTLGHPWGDKPVGAIEAVHGAYLNGWVHEPRAFGMPVELHLWLDGERVGLGRAESPHADGQGLEFWLRIPADFLDNRPHEIAVSAIEYPDTVYALTAQFIPASATPFDALQQYAGTSSLRGYLSPLGPRRYESLRRNMAILAEAVDTITADELPLVKNLLVNFAQGQTTLMRGLRINPGECAPIAFPVRDRPKVSIVIPVHDQFTVTYLCLASIAAAINRATYEIIIVDDGSTDETAGLEQRVTGITVVRNPVALGFVMACNAGAEKARGDYLVMLNNDTEVLSGWLDELLEPFSRFEGVGMTGAKLIYPDGTLQEAGGIVWGNGQPWNVGRNGNASDPRFNYMRQVDYLSGACIMLAAPVWQKLGGFDRHFAPAYYEDTDLAFGVRSLGYKTVYNPFCEVVHYEGMSNGTDTGGSGLKRFQEINAPKFKAKWCNAYRGNGVLGQDPPELMQDRHIALRALVIDAQTLTPDLDAGSYSAVQEIRILQSLGFKVTFLPSNLAYMGGYTEALQRMGVEVIYAPFVTSMAEAVEQRASEFDLFYIARYGIAMQIADTIRRVRPDAKIVLNIHDLHFLREMREALASHSAGQMQQAIKTREEELAVMRLADVVISYSEVEQAIILTHNLDATKTAACPWVVEAAETCPGFAPRQDIAFLGGFGHRPNLEAVQWFVREVMPLLRKKLPGCRLLIYGSKAPGSLKALESDDVILKGYVKTTEEVYDTARVFLAPLLTGAGLKGKVIGAFARGIPTVMTPTAAEGTGARHGLEAFIATHPGEWVEAISRLYQDATVWNAMSEACRRLARDEYSFAKGQHKLRAALQLAGVYANTGNETLWSRYPVG